MPSSTLARMIGKDETVSVSASGPKWNKRHETERHKSGNRLAWKKGLASLQSRVTVILEGRLSFRIAVQRNLIGPKRVVMFAPATTVPLRLALRDAFFNPMRITDEGGIDSLLRGLAAQRMQDVDVSVVDDVRNFLFGPPGSGGFDLVALNIQRGRDHGLPDYNTVRVALGLPPAADFDDITSNPDLAVELAQLYATVDDIDLWVGALAEDHKPGAAVGELVYHALKDQFERHRDGDRFWYEIDPEFTPDQIARIRRTKLSDVIRRNTQIRDMQPNVFFVLGFGPQPAPLRLFGIRFCGPGTLGMMPLMLLGWTGMKRATPKRKRQ